MEQQNGEHIIGEISKPKFKTHNLSVTIIRIGQPASANAQRKLEGSHRL